MHTSAQHYSKYVAPQTYIIYIYIYIHTGLQGRKGGRLGRALLECCGKEERPVEAGRVGAFVERSGASATGVGSYGAQERNSFTHVIAVSRVTSSVEAPVSGTSCRHIVRKV